MITYIVLTVLVAAIAFMIKINVEEANFGDRTDSFARSVIIVILSVAVIAIIQSDHSNLYWEANPLIEACEQELPRSQHCTLVAVPMEE